MPVGADELSGLLGYWASGTGRLAEQLAAALAELVDSGVFSAGTVLPPERSLAEVLSVSRGTVSSAYTQLRERGYLATRHGSGSTVRTDAAALRTRSGERLFSFTAARPGVVDLSTGALPASEVTAEVIDGFDASEVAAYLATDGYQPAGLDALREAVAAQLTRDRLPTSADQILITAGAQQATWLAITAMAATGDLVLVEEPSYRGALEVLRARGVRLRGIPLTGGGLDPDQVRAAAGATPALLYCQTGMHNPTGRTMDPSARERLAGVIDEFRLPTIEDRCSADLTLRGPYLTPSLARYADPELITTIGTTSKLFWGGIRVGWIRADAKRILALTGLLRSVQLSCSILDQLIAVHLIAHTSDARRSRRELLRTQLEETERVLRARVPAWTWESIDGGTGLWVDTHQDAVALAERAKRADVRIVPGPSFSAHGGQRTMVRLPVWHPADQLELALSRFV